MIPILLLFSYISAAHSTRLSLCTFLLSYDAGMIRTGGLRARGLMLDPSVNVFKLPDMTAWSGVFQGAGGD